MKPEFELLGSLSLSLSSCEYPEAAADEFSSPLPPQL